MILLVAALIVLCGVAPFLPGQFVDGILTLSILAQLVGVAGFVLIPVGLVLLIRRGVGGVRLYLVCIPAIVLVAMLALATPLTNRSRLVAIENSAELIRSIEAYRQTNGRYPTSLLAVWPDYLPGVKGIAQYHYEPHGDGYNLVFEQPRFLLDELGAREFVVYNPRNEHAFTSHAAQRLSGAPGGGWFAVRDAGRPQWKSFLFD